jgi:hypothetical protein
MESIHFCFNLFQTHLLFPSLAFVATACHPEVVLSLSLLLALNSVLQPLRVGNHLLQVTRNPPKLRKETSLQSFARLQSQLSLMSEPQQYM